MVGPAFSAHQRLIRSNSNNNNSPLLWVLQCSRDYWNTQVGSFQKGVIVGFGIGVGVAFIFNKIALQRRKPATMMDEDEEEEHHLQYNSSSNNNNNDIVSSLDSLDEEQTQLLYNFKNQTGETSNQRALTTLQSHQWNLEAAVTSSRNSTGSVATTPNSWLGTIYNICYTVVGNTLGYLIPSSLLGAQNELSPTAACTAFIRELDTNYGTQHPILFEGSYQQACSKAKKEFKFLVIYLHSPHHHNTQSFCRDTFCNAILADFINTHFICWGGNIITSEAYKLSMLLGASTYPFIAVICNNTVGGITLVDRMEEPISVEDLMARLTIVLDVHGPTLTAARLEHEERDLDRQIREEQDRAFLESLAEDQEKERKKREEERRLQEEKEAAEREQQLIVQKKQEREERIASLARSLPPEPLDKANATKLVIRLPNGTRLQRSFDIHNKVQVVYDYIISNNIEIEDFVIATNYPRKVFSDANITLQEAGLVPQASLFIEEK